MLPREHRISISRREAFFSPSPYIKPYYSHTRAMYNHSVWMHSPTRVISEMCVFCISRRAEPELAAAPFAPRPHSAISPSAPLSWWPFAFISHPSFSSDSFLRLCWSRIIPIVHFIESITENRETLLQPNFRQWIAKRFAMQKFGGDKSKSFREKQIMFK